MSKEVSVRDYNFLSLATSAVADYVPKKVTSDKAPHGWREEQLQGLRTDVLMWKVLPLILSLEIFVDTLIQVFDILQKYKVLLDDRNTANTFALPLLDSLGDEKELYRHPDYGWSIKQIDFGLVYDLRVTNENNTTIRSGVNPEIGLNENKLTKIDLIHNVYISRLFREFISNFIVELKNSRETSKRISSDLDKSSQEAYQMLIDFLDQMWKQNITKPETSWKFWKQNKFEFFEFDSKLLKEKIKELKKMKKVFQNMIPHEFRTIAFSKEEITRLKEAMELLDSIQ